MAVTHEIRSDGNGKTKIVNLTPIKAIRYQCLECMGFQYGLVADCTSVLCSLYPYRMGKNPERKGIGSHVSQKG